jgi:DNA polymerase I-like protein with 3'-5' exonuclease and polymerase domains
MKASRSLGSNVPLEFPRLSGVCGFDCETRDEDLDTMGPGWAFPDNPNNYVIGFSISWDAGKQTHYFPLRHSGGGNYPVEKTLDWLRSQMRRTDLTWWFYNRLYDEGWLRREGIPVKGKVLDAYTAIPLLDEYRYSYRLDDVGKDYLGEVKDETALKAYAKSLKIRKGDLKQSLWRFPADVVRPYACQDAGMTLRLGMHVVPLLEAENLMPIFGLESRLLTVLLEMRWRGVRVDLNRAEQAAKQYKAQEKRIQGEIKRLCGVGIDVWAGESIQKACDKIGLPYPRTPKTKAASFKKEWLENHVHPVMQLIAKERKLNKTRTTFLESYILQKSHRGRIHSQVNPLPSEEGGAVTGRVSSSNPNLNNLPNVEKDPVNGRLVRGCLLPEEGELWAADDFSQQEPRLMIHFAVGTVPKPCRGSEIAAQRYIEDPDMDFHQMTSDLCGLPRKPAKNIFLGKCYGMGGAKYCRDVGLPTAWYERNGKMIEVAGEEGRAQLDQFDDMVPWVGELSKLCEKTAKRTGFIRTILGRKCRFGGGGGKDYWYKAINRLIQGSAADQIKKAMLDLWDAGLVPLVTVYDELGLSVPSPEIAHKAAKLMIDAVPLRVPMKVDVAIGNNWGEAV